MIDAGHTHASGNICRLLMMFTNMKRGQYRSLSPLVPPGSAAESPARHQSRIHRPRRTSGPGSENEEEELPDTDDDDEDDDGMGFASDSDPGVVSWHADESHSGRNSPLFR